ncbi:MAG: hypothetical protein Q7J04_04280 [Microcella sp.]|nr:hypothetical protein [Microcella sp.]
MTSRVRHVKLIAIGIGVALTLTGCAPAASPSAATTAQLQQTVLEITTAVADDDWESASADLDALEAQVAAAQASGDLSDERAAGIRMAIALVRTDVAAALAPPVVEPEPEPEPSKTPKSEKPEKPENPGNRDSENDKKP